MGVRDRSLITGRGYKIIISKIKNHLDIMCPIKYLKVSTIKPFWLSHHIIESLNERNRLFREAKMSHSIDALSKALVARNRTNKLVNTAKQDFIKESLDQNSHDPKQIWRIINNDDAVCRICWFSNLLEQKT